MISTISEMTITSGKKTKVLPKKADLEQCKTKKSEQTNMRVLDWMHDLLMNEKEW